MGERETLDLAPARRSPRALMPADSVDRAAIGVGALGLAAACALALRGRKAMVLQGVIGHWRGHQLAQQRRPSRWA